MHGGTLEFQIVALELQTTDRWQPEQGYTKLTWKPVRGSVTCIIECSTDPTDPTKWKNVGVSTKSRFTGNGATAGQPCWYRVCGVNALGPGIWSDPALRPVM